MVAESPGNPSNVVDENGLKRRMLGAAVLIALAIIFLPLVFDGSGTESQFRSVELLQMEPPYDAVILEEDALLAIEGATVIDFVEDDQLTALDTKEVVQQADQAQQFANSRPVAAVAEPIPSRDQVIPNAPKAVARASNIAKTAELKQPTISASVQPQPAIDNASWLIQIASFRDKINALGLRGELKNDGHPVVVKVAEIAGDSIFRVFVGPIQGRAEADEVKKMFETRLNRDTLLVEAK